MTRNSQEVYSGIYDIVKENLEKSEEKITFTEDAFVSSASKDIEYIDIFDMLDYDNELFIEAAFVNFFNRTIDEKRIRNGSSFMVSRWMSSEPGYLMN